MKFLEAFLIVSLGSFFLWVSTKTLGIPDDSIELFQVLIRYCPILWHRVNMIIKWTINYMVNIDSSAWLTTQLQVNRIFALWLLCLLKLCLLDSCRKSWIFEPSNFQSSSNNYHGCYLDKLIWFKCSFDMQLPNFSLYLSVSGV